MPPLDDSIPLREYLERVADLKWEAHRQEHAMLQRAIDLGLKTLDGRLNEMNKFRDQIEQERQNFMTKDVYDSKHELIKGQIVAVEKLLANWQGRLWMLTGALTALVVVLNIVFRFIH